MTDTSDNRRTKSLPVSLAAQRAAAVQALSDYRAALEAKYAADLSEWKNKRSAEIDRIRRRLGKPGWHPGTPFARASFGEPPVNPVALPFWQFKLP